MFMRIVAAFLSMGLSSQFYVLLVLCLCILFSVRAQYPAFDGTGRGGTDQGKAGGTFTRIFPPAYQDQTSAPRHGPSARRVSNVLMSQGPFAYNKARLSSMASAWGQLVAHDMAMTGTATRGERI
mmetsp:Transcript_27553/g.47555  ORF Transcript_27553/g.47555 Transcript_27553/m.47555 type:complete len:125 (-) Transcript_27553:744-1118(-)